jgi:hypothetical protein
MKIIKKLYKLFLVLSVIAFVSCEDQLTDMNVNPNGVEPENVDPNSILTTAISKTAKEYLKIGYNENVAGVMQYVQKSGWGSGLNKYDWAGEEDWDTWYENLREAQIILKKAEEKGWEFHEGVAHILRAINFGFIADSWGDAPYSAALKAEAGSSTEELFPAFDTQKEIYMGIIDELKLASNLLSKDESLYLGINGDKDILYNGDVEQWRKLANSLLLRYYMRLSSKDAALAKTGIEAVAALAFESNSDNAAMQFPGMTSSDSWPAAVAFDKKNTNFNRIQLCAGFRDVLVANNDPRIATWFEKVNVQIKISDAQSAEGADVVVDGVRYITTAEAAAKDYVVYNKNTWVADIEADKVLVDTMEYCGIPIASTTGDGSGWNLNPAPEQGQANAHNSALADMFQENNGDLLEAKLITYSEVCFILSEAALNGWSVGGTAEQWYNKGIEASFDYWETSGYSDYIAEPTVAYNGTLEQVMTQKWISNFTIAHESWCDWRRTGFPTLTVGPIALRDAMPLRFRYGSNEKDRNNDNYNAAVTNLVETSETAQDGKDSSWSKFWLLQ